MTSGRDPQQLLHLAQLCYRDGDPTRARALATHALRQGLQTAALLLAEIAINAQDPARARVLARRVPADALSPDERYRLANLSVRLRSWPQALALSAEAPENLLWQRLRVELNRALGRVGETVAALDAAIALDADGLSWIRAQIACIAGEGDPRRALEITQRARHQHPDDRPLAAQELELLTELGDAEAAAAPLADWSAQTRDLAGRLRLVDWRVRLGDLDAAQAALSQLLDAHPTAPGPWVWHARLALWRADTAAARAAAQAAQAHGAGDDAALILAATDVLDGEPARALPVLESLTRDNEDDVAWAWRSEALRLVGQPDEALAAADTAMSVGQRFNLAARINRFLSVSESNRKRGKMTSGSLRGADEIVNKLAGLGISPSEHPGEAYLREALRRIGGNRSYRMTTTDGVHLRAFQRPDDPRNLGRVTQKLLFARGHEATLSAFNEIQARFPRHPLVHTYRGEFCLWLGRYDAAEADFRVSLDEDPQTKWAWIGLGAVYLMRGQPQKTLQILDEGVKTTGYAGPTLFIYRAEAQRALGARDAAIADLKVALSRKPQRLSTWMHLALLDAEDGDTAPASALVACAARRLPGLMLDAGARSDDPAGTLQRAMNLMRGNRSSSLITWFHHDRFRAGNWSPLPEPVVKAFPRWWPPQPEPAV